jgi:ankyrin repeat protein
MITRTLYFFLVRMRVMYKPILIPSIFTAISNDSVEELQLYITSKKLNYPLNKSRIVGVTKVNAIEYAASRGSLRCVQWLLECMGADPGKSLILAAAKKQTETVKYLLSRGVNPNKVDSYNLSALDYAIPHFDLVGVLRHSAFTDAKSINRVWGVVNHASPPPADYYSTVIYTEIARLLIEAGADTNKIELYGDKFICEFIATIKHRPFKYSQMHPPKTFPLPFAIPLRGHHPYGLPH